MPNYNDRGRSPQLSLHRVSDGSSLKPLDATLKTLLDAEEIYDGQALILEYGEKGTEFLEKFDTYKK